jgi:hypothetical protein
MNDVEDLLRERLTTIAANADAPHPALVANIPARARGKRRARQAIAVTAAAVATASVIALSLVVAGHDGSSSVAGPKLRSTTSSPSSPGSPSPLGTIWRYNVAPPIIGVQSGPKPMQQADCQVSQITGTGELRPIHDGVAGVVHLVGKRCSIQLHFDSARLVDAHDQPLAVPVHLVAAEPNPPENFRPDFALAAGNAYWGFAWTGSWCGAPAAAIDIPIHDATDRVPRLNDWIHVPLDGPMPGCTATSDSILVPGVPGTPDQPVLPPPASWSGLSAQLSVPAHSGRQSLTGLTLTLRNGTASDIYLSPCPAYAIVVSSTVSGGTAIDADPALPLPCKDDEVVPAHGEWQFRLPSFAYAEGESDAGAQPGSTVTIKVAIAGVPTASATTTAAS